MGRHWQETTQEDILQRHPPRSHRSPSRERMRCVSHCGPAAFAVYREDREFVRDGERREYDGESEVVLSPGGDERRKETGAD